MTETWNNPFTMSGEELCVISTGSVATTEGTTYMCLAKEKGEELYKQFDSERLHTDRSKKFFDPIRKVKLESFQAKIIKSKTETEKEIELKVDINLFSMMAIVAQNRQLNMKEVFTYPLGTIPWEFSNK